METANVKHDDFIILLPSFVSSELTRAFEIGFLLFLPFLVGLRGFSRYLSAWAMSSLSENVVSDLRCDVRPLHLDGYPPAGRQHGAVGDVTGNHRLAVAGGRIRDGLLEAMAEEQVTIDGVEVIGLRFNWKKRYITLAPVATLIGHGLETIYALPGIHNDHLFDAFQRAGDGSALARDPRSFRRA